MQKWPIRLALLALVACTRSDAAEAPAHEPAGGLPPAGPGEVTRAPADQDSAIFAQTLDWARAQRLDTLALGDIIVAVGQRFLGSPYIAGSLDPPGPETLVINLRAFDCVTYVESVLALSSTIHVGASAEAFDTFRRTLAELRYRDGGAIEYTNRLHYFSEWIAANAARGRVTDVTRDLGGSPDPRPIGFMTAHPDAYPQLASASVREFIARTERRLNAVTRYRIDEADIAQAAAGIRDGDVIAATSNVAGLDIAHTGIAIRVDGRVHLMHAPLAGGVVEVSEVPLAERILRIGGQDGIMVARPN